MTTETKANTWTSEAGPLQTKRAIKAIDSITSRGRFHVELTGVIGGDEDSRELWAFGSPVCDDAKRRLEQLGESFAWTISKKNFKAIIEAAKEAAKAVVLPVVDNRKSADEKKRETLERALEVIEKTQAKNEQAGEIAKAVELLRKEHPSAIGEDKKRGQARAAANIKLELKQHFPSVKFSVRSESFSMGNAVRVSWTDGPTTDQVESITGKYQYYAGLDQSDCQQYDSSTFGKAVDIVLGRAKYVSTSRNVSDTFVDVVAKLYCDLIGKELELESRLEDCDYTLREKSYQILRNSDLRGSVVSGLRDCESPPYYAVDMAQPETIKGEGEEYKIEKHYHTKREADFYIAVPVARLEREVYLSELERAKTFGGWKSRKWGACPSGFGFESEPAALAFAGDLGEQSEGIEIERPGNERLADKLEELAGNLDSEIENRLATSTQNWTPKRGRQWAASTREGNRLERTQRAMRSLAALHRSGAVPVLLAGFTTKKSVYDCLQLETKASAHSCYDHIETSEFSAKSPEAKALQALIAESSEVIAAKSQANELQSKIDGLRLGKEPGFFPTPGTLAKRMIEIADIEPDSVCLEPSAGIGSLAELIEAKLGSGSLQCCEQKFSMAEVCQLKGFETYRGDFIEWAKHENDRFDRIVMNPPFENQQDAKHICKAFELLAPGGRLVALCGANALERDNAAGRAFASLVSECGESNERIDGAFTGPESFKQTGVSVLLLVLTKPNENDFESLDEDSEDSEPIMLDEDSEPIELSECEGEIVDRLKAIAGRLIVGENETARGMIDELIGRLSE